MRTNFKTFAGITGVLVALCLSCGASAQSKNFKMTQGLEVQYNILRALSTNFVDTIDFEKAIGAGIDGMLASLDPYTEYIPEENQEAIDLITTGAYGGIGAIIRKIDSLGVMINQPYEGSPAVKYNLEPGDIITEIDGVDVKPLSADECSKRMRGNPGTQVRFKVKKARTGKVEEIVVTRDRVHTSDVSYAGLLVRNGVQTTDGYIKYTSFSLGGAEEARKAVTALKQQGAKRIILDLRANGGGLMSEAVDLVSIFVPKGTLVVSAKGRGMSANFSYSTEKEPVDTLIPLMVLVNSSSASSSEIVAGALQDLDRATIMGTRTYGKGLVQSFIPVGYNGKLKLTISKYYTPSGRCIQIMDYSHRNPDGSVGAVPDSLKKPFKTRNGRTVYDGGGITPDSLISSRVYSRPSAMLSATGILDEYATQFYVNNLSIPEPEQFSLSDGQYEDFVRYAAAKKVDLRSGAEVILDQMINEAKQEELYDKDKAEFEALSSKLKLSKEDMIKVKREEIQSLLEDEITQRYYYIPGRVRSIIRSDQQLWKAVDAWK